MVDLVEARFDVRLQHPLIGVGGVEEDLLDGVLGPAPRAEAVAARLEVRLEDGLEHQLEGCLHGAVACGGDAKPTKLSRAFRDELLPHRQGDEPPGLEIVSQLGEELLPAEDDGAGCDSIDTGRP